MAEALLTQWSELHEKRCGILQIQNSVIIFPEARTAFSLFDYDIERKTGNLLLKQAFSSSVSVGPKGFQSIGYVVVNALCKEKTALWPKKVLQCFFMMRQKDQYFCVWRVSRCLCLVARKISKNGTLTKECYKLFYWRLKWVPGSSDKCSSH